MYFKRSIFKIRILILIICHSNSIDYNVGNFTFCGYLHASFFFFISSTLKKLKKSYLNIKIHLKIRQLFYQK